MRAFILLCAFLVALASPACAADDVAAAQSVIRSQEQAFSRDDAAAAYSYAAPGIKGIFPRAEIFMSMVQQGYAPVYRHKSFEFGEARMEDGMIAQRVHIVDANGEACSPSRIADRGYIIVHGEIVLAAGSVDELRGNDIVKRLYLGGLA